MTPAPDVLRIVEAAYREHYEVPGTKASVSFVGVEPIEILCFAEGNSAASGTAVLAGASLFHYLSLGMSRYGMSDPAATVVEEASAPRAELLLSVTGQFDELWRKLAVLAAAPVVEAAVYAVGGRVHLGEPLAPGSRCTGAVLTAGPLRAIAVAGLTDVQVLRLLPATSTELAWARVHGSDALLERWTEAGVDLTDLMRDPVNLADLA